MQVDPEALEKVLHDLNRVVNEYYKCNLNDGEMLNTYLQKVNGCLFYLETNRVIFHDQWQSKVHDLIHEQGLSVNRAENIAHRDIPEMYKLRRIMDSGYKISEALRTHISYLKKEFRNN